MDEFKIEGLDDLSKVLAGVTNRFPEEKQKELLKLGHMFEAEIKPEIPVDTGRLRSSINSQITDSDTVETGTNVNYAAAVNDGHEVKQHFVPAKYLDTPNGRKYLGEGNDKGIMVHSQFVLGKHFMEKSFQSFQPKSRTELEAWIQSMLDAIGKNNEDLINTFKNL